MAVKFVKREPIKGPLGRTELYAIGVGQVIGAGIMTYTVTCLKMTGYSAWIAYVAAVLFGYLLVYPNVMASRVLRITGGFYPVVASTMGSIGAGIFSYISVLSITGVSMFIRSTTEYIGDLAPFLGTPNAKVMIGVLLIFFFFLVNWLGMNIFAAVQKLMTWLLIGALVLFVAFGIPRIHLPIFNFKDPGFLINGIFHFSDGKLTGGLFLAVFSFLGSTYGYGNVAAYGGQAKDAKNDIPKVMLYSMLTILVLYAGVAIVAAGCMSIEEYGESTTLVLVARSVFPKPLAILFFIGGPIMAMLTTINATVNFAAISMARSIEDGWFPKSWARKSRYGTYTVPLIIISVIALIPIVMGLNIAQLLAFLTPLISSPVILYLIGYLLLPRRYPEIFNDKQRINKAGYIISCVIALILQLSVFMRGVLASGLIVICVCLGMLLVFALLGIWRAKAGVVTFLESIWDVEEPAQFMK